jgi:hypothetical protein
VALQWCLEQKGLRFTTVSELVRLGGMQVRARSHRRFAPPLVHFIPYLLAYPVPLFLKRQCDRTLAAGRQARVRGVGPRLAHGLPRPL